MVVVRSVHNVPIRLTDERWDHITRRHPEMTDLREKVLETVTDPDLVQEGDSGELLAVRHYSRTSLTEKYLVVPYREVQETDGFILTAYLTNKSSARRSVIWKR